MKMHIGIMVDTITILIMMGLMVAFITGMVTTGMLGVLTTTVSVTGLIILLMAIRSQMDTITGINQTEMPTTMKEFIMVRLVATTDTYMLTLASLHILTLTLVLRLVLVQGIITIITLLTIII
jgi:hypothetical protein